MKIDKKGIDWLKNNLNIYLKYMVIEEQEFLKIINKLNNANIENLIELKEQIENYFLKIIYQNIKEDNFNFINNLINDKIKIRYKFQNIESLKRLVKILNKFKISHNIDFALKLVKENLIVKELISIIVNIFDNNLELIEKRLDDFDCFTYIIAYYLNNDLKTSLKYDFENSISEDSIENNMQEIKKIVLKEWQDPNINSDLIQSGIIGFLESYENFKNKNIPNFSLYAYWWIKKSIIIEKCQNECFFSNSYQINQQLKEYLELKDKLLLLLKKEPTIEDLVLNTNYSKKEILIFERMLLIEYKNNHHLFLEDEFVEYNQNEEILISKLIKENVWKLLNSLSLIEKWIIIYRYGLIDDQMYNYKKIALYLYETKITTKLIPENDILQIEKIALDKIIKSPYMQYFQELLDTKKIKMKVNELIFDFKNYYNISNLFNYFNQEFSNEIILKGLSLLKDEEIVFLNDLYENNPINGFLKEINYQEKKYLLKILKKLAIKVLEIEQENKNNTLYLPPYVTLIEESDKSINYQKIFNLINKGHFDEVRNLLKSDNLNEWEFLLLKALVDKLEYNFYSSLRCYELLKKDNFMPFYIKFQIAKLDIQFGDYDKAYFSLDNLLKLQSNNIDVLFQMIIIDCLEQNYAIAKKKLLKINYNQLNEIHKQIYQYINSLLNHEKISLQIANNFNKYLNFEFLIEEIQKKLTNINPNKEGVFDVYRISLDDYVGYCNGLTKDVEVSTLIGINQIIAIKPIKLSNEFNNENNYYVKERRL